MGVELGNRDDTIQPEPSTWEFSMVVTVEGFYKEESNENVDAYLSAIGVPWIARKAAGLMSPTIEISRAGDDWTMSFKTKAISNTVNFKLGQEFEEKNPGGKVVKGLATFEDNSLVIVTQTEKGEVRRTLQFTDTGIDMTMLLVSQNVSAKRKF